MKLSDLIRQSADTKDSDIQLTISETHLAEGKVLDIDFGSTPNASNKSIISSLGKSAWSFFKNPVVAGVTIGWALNTLDDYNRNKKDTIKLHARTGEERVYFKKMVDEMLASGKYTLIKSKNVSGAYSWTLKRKWGA